MKKGLFLLVFLGLIGAIFNFHDKMDIFLFFMTISPLFFVIFYQQKKIKFIQNQNKELIKNALNVAEELKKGNFNSQFEFSKDDELKALKQILNQMLKNLERRIFKEIQARIKKDRLLIQQSKLATMGEMIGNIAHQWRQPLGELSSILMRLQVKFEHDDLSNDELKTSLQECDKLLLYMSNTISDFQNLFTPSKQKCLFSIKKACDDAICIISSSFKNHSIKLIYENNENIEIYGYPKEFSQVLLNLFSNSKDAILSHKIKESFVKLSIKRGKNYAIIKVEDNAGGIKKEHLSKIFEPYWTTKHAKQGIGIGLYMSKVIIEEMKGFLNVKNGEAGAIFTIKLKLKGEYE